MRIALIVAMGSDRVIGVDGGLPWHLPADLRQFRAHTMGKPILMGRRTHESIGRELPGRTNLVLTRNPARVAEGCHGVSSVEEALAAAADAEELMVIGGARVYEALLGRADVLYLTEVEGQFAGDTYFPRIDPALWQEVERQDHPADDDNPHAFRFRKLVRREGARQ